jgi:hypothetical protein
MSSAQVNKKMREELKLLTRETRALSAIYGVLLQFMSEDQRGQIKSEVRKTISEQFTKEELDSYYGRNSDRSNQTALEFDVLEILNPRKQNDD